MTQPVFRFAPSPNGDLHLGHALSALINQRMAQVWGGRLLLRVEDIDTERCSPELEAAMLDDLAWLGLTWEEPVRRQSEHFQDYAVLLDRLVRDGLVYPAFMSRGEIRAHIAEAEVKGRHWPRDPDGVPLYPGPDKALGHRERRRRMDAGEPYSWRLDMEAATDAIGEPIVWTELSGEDGSDEREIVADPLAWGDVIVGRKEMPTSYHLSVVADDALQGVTHVVRGLDLKAATAVQRVLQQHLGLAAPRYYHHRLVAGPDGRKLSKRFGDSGLAALREAGATPEGIRRMVGLQSEKPRS
jgi:glutamyl-Q tRNA(Asp) synthetase